MNSETSSLQETYAPHNRCFGCGPANSGGLRLRTFADGPRCVARWRPERHHEAFEGVLNGGICGALLDCHSNWTAAWNLMQRAGTATPPCTVTADFHVRLRRPTPMDTELSLSAWVAEIEADRAVIDAELRAGHTVTATCRGTFVAVRPGHPAYHRW